MKLYLLGGLDADGDFFVVGVYDGLEAAQAAIDESGQKCATWRKEEKAVYFFFNAIPFYAIDCEHCTYYIAELTLNEAIG